MPPGSGTSRTDEQARSGVGRYTLAIDVSTVAPAGCHQLAVDVFVPDPPAPSPFLWVCVPGGGMNRRYFDLEVAGASGSFSMARHLSAAGDVVVTVDPPGVGESDAPDDGYALSPHVVADVLAAAVHTIDTELRDHGIPHARLGRLVPRARIGLGHSAGALLVACQQARHGSYDALALLGFSASGLPRVLDDRERAFAGRPRELAEALARLSRARFGEPLPMWPNDSGEDVEPSVRVAVEQPLRSARARLLALVGMTAIVPGSVQPELDDIRVPVFVALGEHDLAGSLDALPGQLPACGDLTLFRLEGAGHTHNIAVNRARLWNRARQWAGSVVFEEKSTAGPRA
jgi:alpha-beta hydrolase superfamily lysophospholipase